MMKNLIPAIIAATAIISMQSACAQVPECPGPDQFKLTVGQYHLVFNERKPVCVTAPGVFKIKIHNPRNSGVVIHAGDATVEDKQCTGLTIAGNNVEDPKKISVIVGGQSRKGYECSFLIRVKGLGLLDPKVRVVDSNAMLLLKSTAFYDVLDTLDLTLEEANKLMPPREAAK